MILDEDRKQQLSRHQKRVPHAVSAPSVNHTFHSVERELFTKYVESELERNDEHDTVKVTDKSGQSNN